MRLGILGGTFDPIHYGHLLTAELARETLNLAQVLFLPAGDPPHKQGLKITVAQHRRLMVNLAISNNRYFELCPVDLERSGPNYTVETVPLIRSQYGVSADNCFFIIGSDSLADLPEWRNPERLIQLCRLAVAHRPGYRPDLSRLETIIPNLGNRLNWVEIPEVGFAGSQIRERVQAGQTIRYQVPDNVIEYIAQHRLYQKP